MPQAKTEVALQFSECCAAETALQHWLFCSAEVFWPKSCAAANEKLHSNIEKAALQESGAFLPLSCGFQAPTFRHPRLGLADDCFGCFFRLFFGCVIGALPRTLSAPISAVFRLISMSGTWRLRRWPQRLQQSCCKRGGLSRMAPTRLCHRLVPSSAPSSPTDSRRREFATMFKHAMPPPHRPLSPISLPNSFSQSIRW